MANYVCMSIVLLFRLHLKHSQRFLTGFSGSYPLERHNDFISSFALLLTLLLGLAFVLALSIGNLAKMVAYILLFQTL